MRHVKNCDLACISDSHFCIIRGLGPVKGGKGIWGMPKEMMQKLTGERDKDKYASWKQSTLRYIRTHRGTLPWDG